MYQVKEKGKVVSTHHTLLDAIADEDARSMMSDHSDWNIADDLGNDAWRADGPAWKTVEQITGDMVRSKLHELGCTKEQVQLYCPDRIK